MNKYTVLIKKDPNTVLKAEATEVEISLLQCIHGVDNVMNADSRSIADGLGSPSGTNGNSAEVEFDRLDAKYGMDAIKEVYGTKTACLKAIRESMPKPAPAKAAKAKASGDPV